MALRGKAEKVILAPGTSGMKYSSYTAGAETR